jgi:photosystem II stability/assembly factor-like uncharacterized protein
MRRTGVTTLALAVLFSASAACAQETPWKKISDSLFAQAEGYSDLIPGGRRAGGIAVDRHSGDLFACLNGPPFGVWRSEDQGQSWKRIDDGDVVGGWTRTNAICFDPNTSGRMAFFRVFPPPGKNEDDKAQSSYTLDAGKTWTNMTHNEYVYAGGGWVHGMVDWSDDAPPAVIAQSRAKGSLFLSLDGGKEWVNTKIYGVLYGSLSAKRARELIEGGHADRRLKLELTYGYGLCDGALLVAGNEGIRRSTDQGKTFEKVSEARVTSECPVRLGDRLYWLSDKGVIVSDDKGATWSLLGSELPGAAKGPLFGKNASQMLVVTDRGVFKTEDAARTWKKVSDLFWVPDTYKARFEQVLRRHDYAWDPQGNVLYVSGLAGSIYSRPLEQ